MVKSAAYMRKYRARKKLQAQQVAVAAPISAATVAENLDAAIQANDVKPDVIAAGDMSQQNLQQLVQNQQAYMLTDPDADIARALYISKAVDSNGYSMSQNLNHALNTGGALGGNEAFIYDHLRGAMQPLGEDVTLYRGAHANVVQALGVNDWSNMSTAQLQSALVGQGWTSRSFTSSSYDNNKNPFFSGPQSGGREVVLRMHTSSQTRVMLGARSQAEIIADIGTHFQVTNVAFTGQTATPRMGRPTPQIVLDVDVW